MTTSGQGKELRIHYDGVSTNGRPKKTGKKRRHPTISRDSSVSESLTSGSRSGRSAKSWTRNHDRNHSQTSRAGAKQRGEDGSSDDDDSQWDNERVCSNQSYSRKSEMNGHDSYGWRAGDRYQIWGFYVRTRVRYIQFTSTSDSSWQLFDPGFEISGKF